MMWQPGMTLAHLEKHVIYEALQFYGGNKMQAANALGISCRTLYNKLEVYEKVEKASVVLSNEEKEKIRLAEALKQDKLREESENALREKAKAGMGIQSASQVSSQQPLPVRKQEEIQEVPLAKSAGTSERGRR